MGVEPGLHFLDRGCCGSHPLDDELDLLSNSAPHDRIVPIEAHRDAFTVEDLFPHPVVDQGLKFLFSWRSLPGALELHLKAKDLPARHDDFLRRAEQAALEPPVHKEERQPKHEEVKQRFSQNSSHQSIMAIPPARLFPCVLCPVLPVRFSSRSAKNRCASARRRGRSRPHFRKSSRSGFSCGSFRSRGHRPRPRRTLSIRLPRRISSLPARTGTATAAST